MLLTMAQQLFRRKPEEPKPDKESYELARRLRTLEERYLTLERRSQVTEENMIENNHTLTKEIKLINEDIREIKKSLAELSEKMNSLITELQDFSRKDEVEVLKKYLDYWDPLKSVTQEQVEAIVKEALESQKERTGN